MLQHVLQRFVSGVGRLLLMGNYEWGVWK